MAAVNQLCPDQDCQVLFEASQTDPAKKVVKQIVFASTFFFAGSGFINILATLFLGCIYFVNNR